MFLAVDIGNTSINFGVFEDCNIVKTFKIFSQIDALEEVNDFLKSDELKNVEGCIIASVVKNVDNDIKNITDKVFNIDSLVFSAKTDCGMNLKLQNAHTVGVDRIANALGAKKLYKTPVIVIDAGTATTIDIVDKNGDFIGGAIMPGIETQLKVLNKSTSQLPKVEAGLTRRAIGDNTQDAILSGVVRGSAYAIDGLIKASDAELGGKAFIVGTGGDIKLLAQYMQTSFDVINPNLTLEGLKLAFDIIKQNS